jgi:hypothetical protein
LAFGANYQQIILSIVVGAIIVGVVLLLLRLFLKRWNRAAQLAIENKLELYEPLYNEIKKIHVCVTFYENPWCIDIRREDPLTYWGNLPPNVKSRAPEDVTDLLQNFYKKAREYFALYLEAGKILHFYIRNALKKRKQELGMDEQELNITEAKLYDSYDSDFYSGRILARKHCYELETLLKVKNPQHAKDYKTIPIRIFNEISHNIKNDRWFIKSANYTHYGVSEFRESRNQLINIIEEMEKNLKEKIDYITKNYQNHHSTLQIIITSIPHKKIKV